MMSPRILLILAIFMPLQVLAQKSAEQEIHYLLDFVSTSGCVFIRNGSDHSAEDAADHLRLKYRRGARYAPSAETFIDRLASKSSWSGEPYTVRCGDVVESSGDWLHRALTAHRQLANGPE